MLDPSSIPPVASDEILARYILYSGHVRKDSSLRPDTFIPRPYQELSVTRHRDATEEEVWNVGSGSARKNGRTLYGRGDVAAMHFLERRLSVLAKPVDGNQIHADVSGWPKDKFLQKQLAQVIARHAKYSSAE